MLDFSILQLNILFQTEVDKGYFSDEYYFYDFNKTLKHWKLRPDQLISILKDEYKSKWVVIFEATILYNVSNTTIAINVPLTYCKKELMN